MKRVRYQHDTLDAPRPADVTQEQQEERGNLREDDNGNLTSSRNAEWGGFYHLPVLDFDFPCRLVPSRSEGCFHFYIDRGLSTYAYEKLLEALETAGLIEAGFASQFSRRGFTSVRTEGTFVPHSRTLEDKRKAGDGSERL